MAAIVSTRITRLQAISPRISAANLPASLSAVTLASTQGNLATPGTTQVTLYWNATANQFEIWKDSEFSFIPSGVTSFTISVPIALTPAVPVLNISINNVAGSTFTGALSASLNSCVPAVSVTATSP